MRCVACGGSGVAMLAIVVGCSSPKDIYLAKIVDAGTPDGESCMTSSECGDSGNFFCSKQCDPITGALPPSGKCQPVPTDACPPDEYGPICGCDGVTTYYNDCFRRKDGANPWYSAPCKPSCGGQTGCNKGTCAYLYPALPFSIDLCNSSFPVNGSGLPATGTCWVAPDTCSKPPGYMPWSCDGGTCVDLCTAIHSGSPHLLCMSR